MWDFLIAVLAVLFVFGIAINIHEFGHFIVAKLLGMRIEAYSFFGLGPRIWGFKRGHTDYRISAIPLGAYVKLYGDEATGALEGKDQEADVPESELYELRPRWQKFLVMVGGPFMNILLALAIPFSSALLFGVPATPDPIVSYVQPDGAAEKAGIKVGDKIVAFDGEQNPTWRKIQNNAAISPEKEIPLTVERSGEKISLTVTPSKIVEKGQAIGELDMKPDTGTEQVIAGKVYPDTPAEKAGMQDGDKIISLNGENVRNTGNFMAMVQANKEKPLKILVERNGEKVALNEVTAEIKEGSQARIGVGLSGISNTVREPAGLIESANFAVAANIEILRLTARVFGQVGRGERSASETVSGPIGIVQIITQVVFAQGWAGLFAILALISLNLGIFNLLPIPMLDGGQIMVLGIEGFLALFGLKLSMRIKENIQLVGLAVILLLMIFTIFNDVTRLFR